MKGKTMAPKKIVEFQRGYGRYNKGERAGFDAKSAEKLCDGEDPVAKMVGDAKGASSMPDLVVSVDSEALAALRAEVVDLEAEKSELVDKIAALVDEKVALVNEVTALKAGAKPPEKDAKAEPGQPPKTK